MKLYDRNGTEYNILEKGDVYATTYTLEDVVVEANSNLTVKFINTLIVGYTRNMYMIGFENGSNGFNSSFIHVYLSRSVGNDTYVYVKNTATTQAKVTISLRVLYIKE